MMTPLERAARALHHFNVKGQHPKPENFPWEELSPRDQALLRARAHAVLTAIREPSDGMIADANEQMDVDPELGHHEATPESIWQAMIDAALEEG